MSLINDALKKAQTDVERVPVNPMAGSLAGAHVRQEKRSPYLKLVVIAMFLGVSVWAVSLFLGNSESPKPVLEVASATPQAESANVAPSESEMSVPSMVETTEPSALPASAAETQAPIETTPDVQVESEPVLSRPNEGAAEIPASVAVQEQLVETIDSTPEVAPQTAPEASAPTVTASVEATPPATPPSAVAATSKPATDQGLKDEIIYSLKRLEITAVMGDGSKARIMSGGQIHRAGELINLDLKLRFQGKKGKILYFSDPNGEIYEKSL